MRVKICASLAVPYITYFFSTEPLREQIGRSVPVRLSGMCFFVSGYYNRSCCFVTMFLLWRSPLRISMLKASSDCARFSVRGRGWMRAGWEEVNPYRPHESNTAPAHHPSSPFQHRSISSIDSGRQQDIRSPCHQFTPLHVASQPALDLRFAHDGASEARLMSRLWLALFFYLAPHPHRPNFCPISGREAAIALLTSI